jgi:Fur family transcriptional regulator, peroxide stress response regulator
MATGNDGLRGALAGRGLALTTQRRLIFGRLAEACDHPTAEQLHERLRDDLPRLSLATVYKTLHLFAELGLARAVATPDGRARFDAPRERHHHLRCVRCGVLLDVFDARLDVAVPAEVAAATGFEITGAEVQLAGICPACQRLRDRAGGPGLRRRHATA